MPAICDSITAKLTENMSFKKAEKENFENHLAPTAKQVLSAKIEYEQVESYNSLVLSNLQTKYILLKPNQPALSSNGEHYSAKTHELQILQRNFEPSKRI